MLKSVTDRNTLEALHYVGVLGILIELYRQDEFISQALIQFSLRASDAKGNQQHVCQVRTTGDVLSMGRGHTYVGTARCDHCVRGER